MTEYAEARANRTPEQVAVEKAELLLVHGAGEIIVDCITGEKVTT